MVNVRVPLGWSMSGRSDPKTTAMIPRGGEMLALIIENQITNPAMAWVEPINF